MCLFLQCGKFFGIASFPPPKIQHQSKLSLGCMWIPGACLFSHVLFIFDLALRSEARAKTRKTHETLKYSFCQF